MDLRARRLVERGLRRAELGRHRSAIRLFRRALAIGAEPWVGMNLGNSYREVGDPEKALRAFERAWREGDDDDSGWNMAILLHDIGCEYEYDRLILELHRNGYPAAAFELANQAYDAGRPHDAIRLIWPAAENRDYPFHKEISAFLGRWLAELNLPGGEEWLNEALPHPDARVDLAELLLREGRVREARALLHVGVDNDETGALLMAASIEEDEGNHGRAETLLRRAVDLGDSHAAFNLYLILTKLERSDARQMLELAARRGDAKAIAQMSAPFSSDVED